jgi:hypothetical protein
MTLLAEANEKIKMTRLLFVSLEKYWHLDSEIHQLLKSLKK